MRRLEADERVIELPVAQFGVDALRQVVDPARHDGRRGDRHADGGGAEHGVVDGNRTVFLAENLLKKSNTRTSSQGEHILADILSALGRKCGGLRSFSATNQRVAVDKIPIGDNGGAMRGGWKAADTARAGDLRARRRVPYCGHGPRSAQHPVRSDPGGRAAAGGATGLPVRGASACLHRCRHHAGRMDDSGRVTAVEVTWLYDELYTLDPVAGL
jgi:hypothetical protein